jgi:hypothetical protein
MDFQRRRVRVWWANRRCGGDGSTLKTVRIMTAGSPESRKCRQILRRRSLRRLSSPESAVQGGTDGASLVANIVFGPDGTLYGTTSYGAVFKLRPSAFAKALGSKASA